MLDPQRVGPLILRPTHVVPRARILALRGRLLCPGSLPLTPPNPGLTPLPGHRTIGLSMTRHQHHQGLRSTESYVHGHLQSASASGASRRSCRRHAGGDTGISKSLSTGRQLFRELPSARGSRSGTGFRDSGTQDTGAGHGEPP